MLLLLLLLLLFVLIIALPSIAPLLDMLVSSRCLRCTVKQVVDAMREIERPLPVLDGLLCVLY